jgi:hypothetical protein
MSKSYAIYAVKPRGMDSGIREIIRKLFDDSDKSVIDSVLNGFDSVKKDEFRKVIQNTNILYEIPAVSPNSDNVNWRDSFWDFNYEHLKSEYYYKNYIKKFGGRFTTYIFESSLDKEFLLEGMRTLKGRTTFVYDTNEGFKEDNIVMLGKGIRGLFTTDAVILTDKIIDGLIGKLAVKNPDIIDYLNQLRGKDLLFPSVSELHKDFLYNILPVKMQDDLNSHRIHSVDSKKILVKSLKWLDNESEETDLTKIINIINE